MKKYNFQYILFALFALSLLVSSCKPDSTAKNTDVDPVLQEIGGDYYQDLIRTPVKPDGTIDTANMAQITFDKELHNFGTINQGEKREHIFGFTNTGAIDLIVISVKSSCGCTIPSYSETPIKPGERGEIKLAYDSTNRKGVQEKKIIVSTNTFPNQRELTIIADIIKK